MRPVVAVACCRRMKGDHPFHMVGEKYLTALHDGSHAIPFLVPALEPALDPHEILENVQGVLLTGSQSNVSPHLYGGPSPREGVLQDAHRDGITLPLLKAAIEEGIPVFAICRGFQELNVAMGGTLHQHVHEVAGRNDHREDENADLDTQYGPSHDVHVASGGLLARITGREKFRVNSLHHQGIDRLAPGLSAEAYAPDGQIEAVTTSASKGFVLGVQWHPEWRWSENEISRALFSAFGKAIRS